MNSSERDYRKLYLLQDKFLEWWATQDLPFYLTGGTALGRYYLNHRYSEDLDFFVNDDKLYKSYIDQIRKNIVRIFKINLLEAQFSEDFTRFFINDGIETLKIEFINDVSHYTGNLHQVKSVLIDNPGNILANKLTAIVGRDEPKDIFDIVEISKKYSFNWTTLFNQAKLKSILNEVDIEQRIFNFPVEWIEKVNWLEKPVDITVFKRELQQIADDFLFGRDNSLGVTKLPIGQAQPVFFE